MSAWIKMRVGLLKHPKVVRMSSALNADRKRIVGGLYEVWSLIDEHSADGVLPGYDLSAMDESIGWPGFSAAMQAVEWLTVIDPQTLAMPRFDTHNGHSAKRRAMETERKTASRLAPKPVPDLSASNADKKRTRVREEKEKKEQKQKQKNTPYGVLFPEADPKLLADFAIVRKAKKLPLTQSAADGIRREAELAGMTIEAAIRHCCENGWAGFKASWLNNNPSRAPNELQRKLSAVERSELACQRDEAEREGSGGFLIPLAD